MQLTIIAAIFIAIVGGIFAMQNNVPVTVNFLLWRFDSSLAMVLLFALAIGATVIALLTTPATVRRKWQLTRQGKRIAALEKDEEFHKARIAELEMALPAEAEAEAAERPYVGLKDIMAARAASAGDKKDPA